LGRLEGNAGQPPRHGQLRVYSRLRLVWVAQTSAPLPLVRSDQARLLSL